MTLPTMKAGDQSEGVREMTEVKLEDLREGDVVDVVLRGLKVDGLNDSGGPRFSVEGNPYGWYLHYSWFTDATITRRDPPIEVGDVVRFKGCPAPVKVLAIAGHEAWLDVLHMQRRIHNLCDLTLISKGPKS